MIRKMNAEEMLLTLQNALAWCDEGEHRRVCSITYEPKNEWVGHSITVQDSDSHGDCQCIYSPSEIIDIPANVRKRKIAELIRLQEELAE